MTIETMTTRSAELTRESGSISVDEMVCPTCDQPVSPEKFEQIQVRVEGEERARAAKIERTLQARFVGEMAKVEAAKKAEVGQPVAAQLTSADRRQECRGHDRKTSDPNDHGYHMQCTGEGKALPQLGALPVRGRSRRSLRRSGLSRHN